VTVWNRLVRQKGLLFLGAFFGTKVLAGLVLLKLSTGLLAVADFALFSQFVMLWALLNLIASGGVQNGLIRQIAGADDDVAARTAFRAGVRIWAAAAVVLVPLILLRDAVSVTLVGTVEAAWLVPWLVGGAILAGAGQLCSSVLIGSGRLAANLASQTAGLIGGFVAAVACLYQAGAGWAVLAFAGGSLLTPLTAWFLARSLPALGSGRPGPLAPEVRTLMSYSGAFLAVAVVTPAVLFALRHFYREAFGIEALAEWLVANRISDVSTQLIGLFMVQWYLPTISGAGRTPSESRTATLTAFVVGSAVMLLLLAVFVIGAPVLVPLLLSEQYLAASRSIGLYMLGDVMRVAVSIAMFQALSQRRLRAYFGIEAAAAALVGIVAGFGILQRWADAPYVAYVFAYGLLSAVICARFVLSRQGRTEPATTRAQPGGQP
jgi:O-antigen/teichoic acid export membrane protein